MRIIGQWWSVLWCILILSGLPLYNICVYVTEDQFDLTWFILKTLLMEDVTLFTPTTSQALIVEFWVFSRAIDIFWLLLDPPVSWTVSYFSTDGTRFAFSGLLWQLNTSKAITDFQNYIHRTWGFIHTSYLSRTPQIYSCKFFLAGVNFYRFSAKNWHIQQILREKVAFFLQI